MNYGYVYVMLLFGSSLCSFESIPDECFDKIISYALFTYPDVAVPLISTSKPFSKKIGLWYGKLDIQDAVSVFKASYNVMAEDRSRGMLYFLRKRKNISYDASVFVFDLITEKFANMCSIKDRIADRKLNAISGEYPFFFNDVLKQNVPPLTFEAIAKLLEIGFVIHIRYDYQHRVFRCFII